MRMILKDTLKENLDALLKICASDADVLNREFSVGGKKAAIVFLEGASDQEAQRDLMSAVLSATAEEATADGLTQKVVPVFGVTPTDNTQGCIEAIFRGDTVMLLEGETQALTVATASWEKRAITEPPTSTVLQGPREGFTEDLKSNLVQLRRRLQTPGLVIRHVSVGRITHTDVAIVYLKKVADVRLARQIERKIADMDFDGILDTNYIVETIEPRRSSLFPQTGSTEKPDVLTAKLLEGRIGVMINGSPIVMTLPFVLYENFQQAEDYYTRGKASTFLRVLRVVGTILGLFLPGAYVAVQIFHYTSIPLSYLYTIMNAVQGLPMMPLMEMIFVLLIFEILHEASFRMPKYVGMAMSVVGALVLGDTAVKAGLISSPSIMIVALSTIALYSVPALIDTFKLLRLTFAFLGGLAGLWGITIAAIAVLLYLSSIDAFGTPYLAPFSPRVGNDLQDGIRRGALAKMTLRPFSIPNKNSVRRGK